MSRAYKRKTDPKKSARKPGVLRWRDMKRACDEALRKRGMPVNAIEEYHMRAVANNPTRDEDGQ